MRNATRSTLSGLCLLALLAAGPVAGAPLASHDPIGATASGQDAASPSTWLDGLFTWLDRILVNFAPQAASLRATTERWQDDGELSSGGPDFGINPQAGPGMDPDG